MQIYTVKQGDSIYAIANSYGIPAASLIFDNQLIPPYFLSVGQSLLIRYPGEIPQKSIRQRNGYAYPFISTWVLEQTLPYLTQLMDFSYGFDPEGNLLSPLVNDAVLLASAEVFSVTPVLVLTPLGPDGNFNNTLISILVNNPPVQENLIGQLLAVMEEKGFQAVDVDFEFVLPNDRDAFTGFVQTLAARLHGAGYRIYVALAPKVSDAQRGLGYEGKDYASLGAAADEVLLMTYEWGYKYGPPLAVAPLDQVRRVAEYGLTKIPAQKINLGLANYGYDWPLPYVRDQTIARTIGSVEAVQIANRNRSEIFFDPIAQSPYFYYQEQGVQHVVWYEDVRSWSAKLELVRELGFNGVGIWQIMNLFRAGMLLLYYF